MRIRIYLLFIFSICLSSCKLVEPSKMFQTPDTYPYSDLTKSALQDYRIQPYDVISLKIYPNGGIDMYNTIDPAEIVGIESKSENDKDIITVDRLGYIQLPQVGKVFVKGYTIPQASEKLEKLVSKTYVKPFVKITILNLQAFIYTGGSAQVISLPGDNTPLIKVLSLAGGPGATGKAYKMLIIRGDIKDPNIQKIDLSTIEGYKKYAGIPIQPNDVIYIETRQNYSATLLSFFTPVLSIITTGLLLYQFILRK